MKKVFLLSTGIMSAVLLSGCATQRENNTAGGAILGGAAGAVIGGAVTGRPGGALAGGLIGAAGGALIGNSLPVRRRCARYGYDYNGNTVCVRYYRY